MKIAFISQYFFPEQFSNNQIVGDLVARGHEVDVVTCVPNYPAGVFFDGYSNRKRRFETWQGARIFRSFTIPRGTRKIQLVLNFLTFPIFALWIFFFHAREKYDVSFVSMPSPLLQALAGVFLKWMRGTPLVYWVQDLWPESALMTLNIKNPIIVRLLSLYCAWLYRRADLIMVQSGAFPASIANHGVPLDKIKVLPNTAPNAYQPIDPTDAPAAGQLVPDGAFTLMFAGNIGESQDFDCLIDAAHVLRDDDRLKWVVIGSGRDEARVKARIASIGLDDKFTFLGRHPEQDMPAFFAHADAMIVSLKDTPIFRLTVPYKVQCYMACGKPIIAALSGEGARIVSQAEAGAVSPASQPAQLAECITKMMDMSAQELQAKGDNARRYFQDNYSDTKVFSDLEKWLQQAVR